MDQWDLSNAVAKIIAFREARDWGQFHRPKELAAGLAIEAAELQEVFLWRDQETAEEFVTDVKRLQQAEEEVDRVSASSSRRPMRRGLERSGLSESIPIDSICNWVSIFRSCPISTHERCEGL